MASPVSSGADAHKLSFAKASLLQSSASPAAHANTTQIAAAGMKPANIQQKPADQSIGPAQHSMASVLQDGSNAIASEGAKLSSLSTSKPKKLIQMSVRDAKEMGGSEAAGPHVHVDTADATSPPHKAPQAPDGMLMPSASDDAGTMDSSLDGDAKPPSLDGKSVASGTTFALDEKESLRPDDSASVQASAEDEDNFTTSASGLPSSRLESDDDTRAFREQLHEIREMGPSRRQQPGSNSAGNAPQGVLYVPPQGPGIGALPSASPPATAASDKANATPDAKLLEALENPRDRIWVLKLEQDVIDFVKDPKETSLNLPQCNSFYRMLAHRIADYYSLGHFVDEVSSAVRLYRTSSCRIPPPLTGIVTPSTAASTPPPTGPQMKILRRGIDTGPAIANGSNMPSSANSENGDSGDDKKKPATREEREARYEAARLRIMGSAKPTESPDGPKEKDESRSSSAAGKKPKKKHRDNSDDGFEARSAYSSYFAGPYAATAYQPSGLAHQMPSAQTASYAPTQHAAPELANYQQYGAGTHGMQWSGATPGNDPSQAWYQNQAQAYDLSQHFGTVMSMQNTNIPNHNQGVQSPYSTGYPHQPYGMPGSWQSQAFSGNNQAPPNGYAAMPTYPTNITSSPQQAQHSQQYPFGQLPSQAMGRPPNALEHPVPGSYKSPHFNPQSQSFVPTQASSPGFRPSMPQRAPTNSSNFNGYGITYPLERQMSSQSQNSSFGSQHPSMQHNNNTTGPRMASQPLTHPLPQPVFPRQPSPNVPLPPKPMASFQQQSQQQQQQPQHQPAPARHLVTSTSPSQNTSSIAKWGTPASLPAKPPPTNEPFDPQRFAQSQRPAGYNTASGRMPSGSLQVLGSVPGVSTQAVLNGSYSPGGKRI